MRAIFWTMPALLLMGCVTTAQEAAMAERNMERRFLIYGAACEKAGFKRDTDAWRLCVVNRPSHH